VTDPIYKQWPATYTGSHMIGQRAGLTGSVHVLGTKGDDEYTHIKLTVNRYREKKVGKGKRRTVRVVNAKPAKLRLTKATARSLARTLLDIAGDPPPPLAGGWKPSWMRPTPVKREDVPMVDIFESTTAGDGSASHTSMPVDEFADHVRLTMDATRQPFEDKVAERQEAMGEAWRSVFAAAEPKDDLTMGEAIERLKDRLTRALYEVGMDDDDTPPAPPPPVEPIMTEAEWQAMSRPIAKDAVRAASGTLYTAPVGTPLPEGPEPFGEPWEPVGEVVDASGQERKPGHVRHFTFTFSYGSPNHTGTTLRPLRDALLDTLHDALRKDFSGYNSSASPPTTPRARRSSGPPSPSGARSSALSYTSSTSAMDGAILVRGGRGATVG
jgi:hypothetical protein